MKDWLRLNLKDIDQLPTGYGTYAFLIESKVLYIGRSKCLWRRIREHLRKEPSFKSNDCYLLYSNKHEDYCKEKELIQLYSPSLNIAYLKCSS